MAREGNAVKGPPPSSIDQAGGHSTFRSNGFAGTTTSVTRLNSGARDKTALGDLSKGSRPTVNDPYGDRCDLGLHGREPVPRRLVPET